MLFYYKLSIKSYYWNIIKYIKILNCFKCQNPQLLPFITIKLKMKIIV